MKKSLITLINISTTPLGAYLLSFIGLFIYFFFISGDALNLSLTGAFFFALPIAFIVVVIGSILEEIFDMMS